MSVQSIASLSTYTSSANAIQELSIGAMDRALDQMELMGEQIAMMIQATDVMHMDGSTIDILV